ncbi:MAG TPA: hypothetical protein VMU31_09015, partial [Rhizomicrobium sp.]|nr:hypothetical protein [Rhizomicrobium sp.]
MSEALTQVKKSMGVDAVILHTRMIHKPRWLGLRRMEFVEITAGNGIQIAHRPNRRPSIPEAYRKTLTPPRPAVEPARDLGARGRELLEAPKVQTAMITVVADEMSCLKQLVKELVHQTRSQGA